MLPQANADLVKVEGAVASGDSPSVDTWDDLSEGSSTPDQGDQKWAGSVEAYFQEGRDRAMGGQGGAADRTLLRTLIIANGDLPVAISDGDTLTYVRRSDGLSESGRAKIVERRELAGIPAPFQTTRVTFEDA